MSATASYMVAALVAVAGASLCIHRPSVSYFISTLLLFAGVLTVANGESINAHGLRHQGLGILAIGFIALALAPLGCRAESWIRQRWNRP